jgi:5-methyltetrahydrofolate--homocysteine methyltransferase
MKSPLLTAMRDRVILLDGAMGTEIQARNLTPADFGGDHLEGANDWLIMANPSVIDEIHRSYFEAGADMVETNTFGSSRLKLDEYGLGDHVVEVNIAAAELARRAADSYATSGRPRFVAGSMGPSGMLPSSTDPALGAITPDQLEAISHEQAAALVRGGVDALVIETSQDMLEVKSAMFGIHRAIRESGRPVALITQVTLDTTGRMLLGTDVGSSLATITGLGTDVVGLNCSTGPREMIDPIRTLSELSPVPVSCVPNAGMPLNEDGKTVYPLGPEEMAGYLDRFVREFGVGVVGGCCGSTPEHIRTVRDAIGDVAPRERTVDNSIYLSSSMTSTPLVQEPRPLLIGERVNTVGSRKVKKLLLEDDYEGLVPVARDQVEFGAHVLDICTAMTERSDEKEQMRAVVKLLSQSVPAPLMIDTTDVAVLEDALKWLPGRGIVNSINLEGDGSRVHEVLPLVKQYGAAVVCLTIDEEGMAHTADRKLEIARRIHDIAVDEYGVKPEQMLFDPLTFPLTTGDEALRMSALETLEGIRRIKAELSGVLTVLGVSNVSFGVQPYARKVLNSVFLHHAVGAGLDAAIVNPAHITPYPSIPEKERDAADAVIENRSPDALANFIAVFEGVVAVDDSAVDPTEGMSPAEKVHFGIVHRRTEGIEGLLDEILDERSAVDIINGVLLPAMQEVGDKFGSGELILPFVLESAGAMKRAVSHVEQFLEKADAVSRGRVVLATVYGDVHDIGKNLVRTILSNNGYEVFDLGKQVPVGTIIDKAVEVNATAIGLSALLVSTSKQMGHAVKELHERGLSFPVIVGGAAINRRFARQISFMGEERTAENTYSGGVFYANDAFQGLNILNSMSDPTAKSELVEQSRVEAAEYFARDYMQKADKEKPTNAVAVRSSIAPPPDIPEPPFLGPRVVTGIPVRELYPLLDTRELFRLNWGLRADSPAEFERMVDEEFDPILRALQDEAEENEWLDPRLVYGYYRCQSSDNSLLIYDSDDETTVVKTLVFPRQADRDHLCLADYWSSVESGVMDTIAFQVVTVGGHVDEVSEGFNAQGDYSRALYLHGLAVQSAEALATHNNRRICKELGIPEKRGLRFSYGYPACPDLSEQRHVFDLLKPEETIGVHHTEAYQMVPEQSTAAIVGHHPSMKYFNV